MLLTVVTDPMLMKHVLLQQLTSNNFSRKKTFCTFQLLVVKDNFSNFSSKNVRKVLFSEPELRNNVTPPTSQSEQLPVDKCQHRSNTNVKPSRPQITSVKHVLHHCETRTQWRQQIAGFMLVKHSNSSLKRYLKISSSTEKTSVIQQRTMTELFLWSVRSEPSSQTNQ